MTCIANRQKLPILESGALQDPDRLLGAPHGLLQISRIAQDPGLI